MYHFEFSIVLPYPSKNFSEFPSKFPRYNSQPDTSRPCPSSVRTYYSSGPLFRAISIISKSRSGVIPDDVILDRVAVMGEKGRGWNDDNREGEIGQIGQRIGGRSSGSREIAPSKNAKASAGWRVGSTEQLPWLVPRSEWGPFSGPKGCVGERRQRKGKGEEAVVESNAKKKRKKKRNRGKKRNVGREVEMMEGEKTL